MTNLTTKFMLIATLLVASTMQYDCAAGCIECKKGHCLACFRRKFTDDNKQCRSEPAPESEHCDLYIPGNKCAYCQKGFGGGIVSQHACVPVDTDAKCQIAYDVSNVKGCFVCQGGFPDSTYQHCVDFDNTQRGPQKNCIWGLRGPLEDEKCFRCKEGYMVVGGGCVEAKFEGCLEAGILRRQCQYCDPWSKYFARSNGTVCVKDGSDSVNMSEMLKESFDGVKNYIEKLQRGF